MRKDSVTSGGEGLSEEQVFTSRKLYGGNSLSQKPRKGFFGNF